MNGLDLSSRRHTTSLWLTPGTRIGDGVHLGFVLSCDCYTTGTGPSYPTRTIRMVEDAARSRSLNRTRVTKKTMLYLTSRRVCTGFTSKTPQPRAISVSRFHRLPSEGSARSLAPALSKRTLCWNARTSPRTRLMVPWNVHPVVGPKYSRLDHSQYPTWPSYLSLSPRHITPII